MLQTMSPAAQYAAIDAPALPEESSIASRIP
jgi:hypothetical protein